MAKSTAKTTARISFKQSMIVCDAIAHRKLSAAKSLLTGMLDETRNIDGKYYTTAAGEILEVLKSAEANAKQKNLNTDKMFVKIAKADKAFKYMRPKSKFKQRGRQAKISNIEVVLEER